MMDPRVFNQVLVYYDCSELALGISVDSVSSSQGPTGDNFSACNRVEHHHNQNAEGERGLLKQEQQLLLILPTNHLLRKGRRRKRTNRPQDHPRTGC